MTQAFGSAAGVQDSYKRQAHPGEEPRSSPPPQIVPVKRKPEVAAWVSLLRGNSFATALFSGWVPSLPQHPRDQSVKLCKHCCLPDAAGVSPGLFQNQIPRPPRTGAPRGPALLTPGNPTFCWAPAHCCPRPQLSSSSLTGTQWVPNCPQARPTLSSRLFPLNCFCPELCLLVALGNSRTPINHS